MFVNDLNRFFSNMDENLEDGVSCEVAYVLDEDADEIIDISTNDAAADTNDDVDDDEDIDNKSM